MSHVIKTDDVHGRGQRNVNAGRTEFLEGFECNENRMLGSALRAPVSASIDRASGKMIVLIPEMSVADALLFPPGATHFRFFSGGAAINFDANICYSAMSDGPILAKDLKETPRVELIMEVQPVVEGHFFLLLGVEFLQVVNGTELPLVGQSAMALVRVGQIQTRS